MKKFANKKQKTMKKQFITDLMNKFCKDIYGFKAKWKQLPIVGAKSYYITEYGDLFRFKGKNPKGYLVKGSIVKKNVKGKEYKSGFPMHQFYRTKNGQKERFLNISKSKLQLMTWKGISYAAVCKVSVFPIDKDNNNAHIDNLVAYKNAMNGQIEVYGKPHKKRKLTNTEVRYIRNLKNPNISKLVKKHGLSRQQVKRVIVGESYADVV